MRTAKTTSLNQFLKDHRAEILRESEKRVVSLAALRATSTQLQEGLPLFFNQLTEVLNRNSKEVSPNSEIEISHAAGAHGKEFLRLGYTLTHVVHSYGALCQAVTELASQKQAPITALEFHNLNRCLDIAIAGAVTEFEFIRNKESKYREALHLGMIAHELRNVLSRARIAYQMLTKGIVGLGGSTSKIIERSFVDMDILINRSLSEVRIRADSELYKETFSIIEIVNDLVLTAEIEAEHKKQTITIQVDPAIRIQSDRQLVLAAAGNLIQNALKYTKEKGNITIIGRTDGVNAVIEVQDQCGGIPPNKFDQLFKSFSQQSADRSGLGLGLFVSKQAIEKCGGTLTVNNIEDGCAFSINLPAESDPEEPIQGSIV